jgi:hypothetical protein
MYLASSDAQKSLSASSSGKLRILGNKRKTAGEEMIHVFPAS